MKIKCCKLKKYILHYELNDQRDLVFAIAKIPLTYSEEFHIRIIKTIYQNLNEIIDSESNNNNVSFINSVDWLKIGFQSNDPKSDLRSTGMFSLLQTLAFLDKLNPYAKEVFNYSLDPTFNFPFILVLINISSFSLEALREGLLIPFCNSRMCVIDTLNEYFFGLIDHFYTVYKNSNQTMDNVHTLLTTINYYAKENIQHIFRLAKSLFIKYPSVKDSMSLENDISNKQDGI
jgi:hypothetical protein